MAESAAQIYSPAFSSNANGTPDPANLGDLEKSPLNARALVILQHRDLRGAADKTEIMESK